MTFREKIESEVAESERKMTEDPAFFEGGDWWQLSREEEEVFAIERGRWPRMMVAWYAYEAFMDIVAPDEIDSIWRPSRGRVGAGGYLRAGGWMNRDSRSSR